MAIMGRLNKLEKRSKLLIKELERKERERRQKINSFEFLNQIMTLGYPKHGWCKLTLKEKLETYGLPPSKDTVKWIESGIPNNIPFKKEHKIILNEARRIAVKEINKELKRRRELEPNRNRFVF